jgi:hypothetical protein
MVRAAYFSYLQHLNCKFQYSVYTVFSYLSYAVFFMRNKINSVCSKMQKYSEKIRGIKLNVQV